MAALYLYAFAAMQFVVGAAVDAWGPRRAVAAGAVDDGRRAARSSPPRTSCPSRTERASSSASGASVVFIGMLKQVGAWFRPDEFGTWSGLTQVAGNLGGLLAAAPLALVVAARGLARDVRRRRRAFARPRGASASPSSATGPRTRASRRRSPRGAVPRS